jgi:hypothetical protein
MTIRVIHIKKYDHQEKTSIQKRLNREIIKKNEKKNYLNRIVIVNS